MSSIALRSRNGGTSSETAVKDLETTIAGFQAILTVDSRQKFHKLKETPHDSQNIITFTAELDSLDKTRRGKSVASRLASFLQTIQQFTPIVDTYIQANPDIAALVWGSIKLTFMLLARITAYFQSFVELLHGFGSLSARFAEYQVIFGDSPRLKTSICQFHIAVVTCCTRIVSVVELQSKSLKNQIVEAIAGSFQSDMRTHVESIRAKAQEVQEEIQLAKAQCDREEQMLQTQERKKTASHRNLLVSMVSQLIHNQDSELARQKRKERDRYRTLLKDLSSYDYTSAFNSTRIKRHLGTAEWVFKTPEYQEWISPDGPQVLCVTGKIGSGKTVLTSSIIEKLSGSRPPEQFTSFFFQRFDSQSSLDIDTIIRSFAWQLLSALDTESLDPHLASELCGCLSKANEGLFSRVLMAKLYLVAAKTVRKWYIVLDGLDESGDSQQTDLLKFFKTLDGNFQHLQQPKILLSSRESCSYRISQRFPGALHLKTGHNQTTTDIRTYVDDLIAKRIPEDLKENQILIDEISAQVMAKEQGMFLWAFLIIQDICSKLTVEGMLHALEDIPTDLDETINRALRRIIQKKHDGIAKRIFSWTKAALEPLTLSQLREALSIKAGQDTLSEKDLVVGMYRLPSWCESLVYVEETDDTVHFSHHSILEFLLTPEQGELQDLHLNAEECDRIAGVTCITYINLSNFQTALCETEHDSSHYSGLNIEPASIVKQSLQTGFKGSAGLAMSQLARRLLKTGKSGQALVNDVSVPNLGFDVPETSKTGRNLAYPFFGYASRNWANHIGFIKVEDNSNFWSLFGKTILEPPHHSKTRPWIQNIQDRVDKHSPGFIEYGITLYPTDTKSLLPKLYFHNPDPVPLAGSCLAFVYADYNHYWGLACRAFQLLATASSKDLAFYSRLFHLFAANKNYDACGGQCFAIASHELDHTILITEFMSAIASGRPDFPAIQKQDPAASCRCFDKAEELLDELRPDVCELMTAGYNRSKTPHIQPFLIIAKRSMVIPSRLYYNGQGSVNLGNLSFKKLCELCQVDPIILFNARSKLGLSLFDIYLRHLLLGDTKKVTRFLEKFWGKIFPVDLHFQKKINDTINLIHNIKAANRGDLYPASKTLESHNNKDRWQWHGSTVTELFRQLITPHQWSRTLASHVVKEVFGAYVTSDLEYALEEVFRQAVWNNNSEIAAAVLDVEPLSSANSRADDAFNPVRDALRCSRCWSRTEKESREMTTMGTGPALKVAYLLCVEHKEIFSNIRHFEEGGFHTEYGSLFCLGFATKSLPTQEGTFETGVEHLFTFCRATGR